MIYAFDKNNILIKAQAFYDLLHEKRSWKVKATKNSLGAFPRNLNSVLKAKKKKKKNAVEMWESPRGKGILRITRRPKEVSCKGIFYWKQNFFALNAKTSDLLKSRRKILEDYFTGSFYVGLLFYQLWPKLKPFLYTSPQYQSKTATLILKK